MVRTRVGYAGGQSVGPTYHDLDGHSETIQIEYNPDEISYQQLLDTFWASHNPVRPPMSEQYASIIFYHDAEQKRLAEESRDREMARRNSRIYTEIRPAEAFYQAEDYHQKFYMRRTPELYREYRRIYPEIQDFIASTAVARVNGYLGGFGTVQRLEAEADDLGLSPQGKERLMRGWKDGGGLCP